MRYLIMALCLLFACPAWAGENTNEFIGIVTDVISIACDSALVELQNGKRVVVTIDSGEAFTGARVFYYRSSTAGMDGYRIEPRGCHWEDSYNSISKRIGYPLEWKSDDTGKCYAIDEDRIIQIDCDSGKRIIVIPEREPFTPYYVPPPPRPGYYDKGENQ